MDQVEMLLIQQGDFASFAGHILLLKTSQLRESESERRESGYNDCVAVR